MILLLLFTIRIICPAVTALPSSHNVGIVTWNLLAPQYAVAPKYPHHNKDYLDWSYRQSLIVDILQQSPTNDIICLQEVQVDLWEDLQAAFNDTYTTILQQVQQHPVVCAVLVRREHWNVLHTESRSRALLCILEHRASGVPWYVACVHLEAGAEKDETRWNQLKSLLQRVQHHQSERNDKEVGKSPLVITGDFNLWQSKSHPLYQILATGRIPQVLPWDTQRIWLESPSWTQLLPLVDVQASQQQPTFAGGSILDYIWVSPHIQVGSRWKHGSVVRRRDDEKYPPQAWPSQSVPSDHIPIGVRLKMEG